ncbi:hypothetical protein [Sinorhizobium fredii]|uniref:hypothetical protein n=1 Tax=Rhizobium fredii TaxID=380 RepID=UPI0004B3E96B|nr:hypothetical protein [Sinorhizobium fredii]
MFIIKHSVQNRDGGIIFDEPLALGGATYEECKPHMEQLAKGYDHYGYDGQNDRWWGWNDANRSEMHYWWAIPLVPAVSG